MFAIAVIDHYVNKHQCKTGRQLIGTRFSKAPESFRARKAIFRSSVSNFFYEGNLPSSLEYVNKAALYSQGSRFCNGFTGPKSFRGFRETAPRNVTHVPASVGYLLLLKMRYFLGKVIFIYEVLSAYVTDLPMSISHSRYILSSCSDVIHLKLKHTFIT